MAAGFALLDGLVALLLFGVVLLVSLSALLRGLHSLHDAVLTGRAVDLAADLLEARRAQPDEPLAPLLDAWSGELAATLPETAALMARELVQPLLTEDAGAVQ
jgi:Tfp pilus assembly protein PilV